MKFKKSGGKSAKIREIKVCGKPLLLAAIAYNNRLIAIAFAPNAGKDDRHDKDNSLDSR